MARRSPRKIFDGMEKGVFKKKSFSTTELLNSIDETPEFHDPYSELNLFLSQKVKQEMHHCVNPKKWSVQLQEELLHKITPEFQRRFPKYRLGVCALKKTWEKVHYFSTQIQGRKEALTQDGKFNLSFFIKENLKTTTKLKNTCSLHPYHYAHQLAVKMSECIAVVDGVRPKLDQLTRTIWSLQRHLIPKLSAQHFKSPYDENEKIDKLIVKSILEITAKHPQISQAELSFHVQKRLVQLKIITTEYSSTQIQKMLTALLADQCHFTSQRMEKTLEKIPYPIAKCLKSELANIAIDTPHLKQERIIEDALEFFQKAKIAMERVDEEEIERKIQNWSIQGDMLLRWIRLNHNSALYKQVEIQWKETTKMEFGEFVTQVHAKFLENYPKLLCFAKDIELRIWIFLKYIWYKQGFGEEVTTFERFVEWQKQSLHSKDLSSDQLLEKLETLCKRMLPLMPFNNVSQTPLLAEIKNSP